MPLGMAPMLSWFHCQTGSLSCEDMDDYFFLTNSTYNKIPKSEATLMNMRMVYFRQGQILRMIRGIIGHLIPVAEILSYFSVSKLVRVE